MPSPKRATNPALAPSVPSRVFSTPLRLERSISVNGSTANACPQVVLSPRIDSPSAPGMPLTSKSAKNLSPIAARSFCSESHGSSSSLNNLSASHATVAAPGIPINPPIAAACSSVYLSARRATARSGVLSPSELLIKRVSSAIWMIWNLRNWKIIRPPGIIFPPMMRGVLNPS